jgi:hypothetical protein
MVGDGPRTASSSSPPPHISILHTTITRSTKVTTPFLHHSGSDLRDLPDQYLDWLATCELRPPLFDEVRREQERRRTGVESPPRMVSFLAVQLKIPWDEVWLGKRVVDLGRRAPARRVEGDPAAIERLNALAAIVATQLEVRL